MSYLGPSVLYGRVRYLSVSQLDKFDERVDGGCARRWWYRYVGRVAEGETTSQKLGTQVHAQVEHYLKTGQDTLGPLARAGMRFFPRPGRDLLVEYEFGRLYEHAPGGFHGPIVSILRSCGIPFTGKIDLLHARGEWLDDDGALVAEPGIPEIVDWKSTKQILDVVDGRTGALLKKGWAKTAAAIASGWQGRGYAKVALELWPEAPAVRMGHGYFQTTGQRESLKRSSLITASAIQTGWDEVDEVVSKMEVAAACSSPKEVRPNYAACGSYGGCPYLKDCPRDAKLVLVASLMRRK